MVVKGYDEDHKNVLQNVPLVLNVRSHTAIITQQYLNDVDIDILEWPVLSPGVNPIKHVWDMLGRTLNELQHALLEEWDLIPQQGIRHLILGMPRRMQAIIRY
nr:unnamed protein product [Callosobruchus chinensis]